ncbi:hypothetical protein OROHE_022935 [Orobanche hederae]
MRSSNNPLTTPNYSLVKKLLLSCSLSALLSILLIHFYFNPLSFFSPYHRFPSTISPSPSSSSQECLSKKNVMQPSCDYTQGEWVRNNIGPLYNGTTCDTIKTGQNCMVYGRPDKDYLHWKWKPKNCELPMFDPKTFLKLLENKHVAFVGDSLARNQLESLLCMLATVSKPYLYYAGDHENKFRKWHLSPHNINVSIYWSPFLVKGVEKTNDRNFNTLYLDSVDEKWANDLRSIDVLVLSIGFYDVFSKALETVFVRVIGDRARDGNAISVILTTFSPAHFEGEWDKFGACSKTRPYEENEMIFEGMNEEMRKIGVEKVKEAKLRANNEYFGNNINNNVVRIEGLDISNLALLRPDGHPGPYMNPFPFANGVSERVQNDCVHWCLPGPIDTWNEILLDVIKRWEIGT